MKNFKLPKGVRFSEECGLHLVFQEVKVRGSSDVICQVVVTEEGNGHDVNDMYDFSSWDEMKKQYPEMMDFLKELSDNPLWESGWRDNDRIYFIASVDGNEGLYDMEKTVWFDAQEPEAELETKENSSKTISKKKKI